MVGVSGVAINQVVIWLCMNWLFRGGEPISLWQNVSMAIGIVLGMTNNFHWNRKWTWKDRERTQELPVVHQYLQYAAANWPGIVVQVALTNLLVQFMHLQLANLFRLTELLIQHMHSKFLLLLVIHLWKQWRLFDIHLN